jgi:hypothetical protein
MTAKTKLSQADREALQRAIDIARAESEQERAHIDRVLAADGWQRAGETAAYHLQDAALHLAPWQTPPCWIHDDDDDMRLALAEPLPDHHGYRKAAQLVLKLTALGLSRFEPDPLGALARGEEAEAHALAATAKARRKNLPDATKEGNPDAKPDVDPDRSGTIVPDPTTFA